MADFEHTRVIDAEPELVFDIASSQSSLDSWTPEGVEVEPAGKNRLHAWVTSGSEVRDEFGYVDTDQERKRLRWGGIDTEYEGWLQVEPHAADGGTDTLATLHVSFSGGQPETLDGEYSEEVDRRLQQALDRLVMLVRDQAESGR